MRLLMIDIDI